MYKPRELLRLSPSSSRESSVASAASAQSAVSGFSAATSTRCYDETDKEGDVDVFVWFDDDDDVDAWHDECHSLSTTPMRAAKALCDVDATTPAKDVQLPDVPAGRFKRAIKNNENGDLKPAEVFAAPRFTTGPMNKRQKQEARANAKQLPKLSLSPEQLLSLSLKPHLSHGIWTNHGRLSRWMKSNSAVPTVGTKGCIWLGRFIRLMTNRITFVRFDMFLSVN